MKTNTQCLSQAWQVSLMALFCAVILIMPDVANAAGGAPTAIGNTLCKVVGWFSGNTGKGIATLAIIIIGVGALMGKVSWGMAIIVGIGVALIFGAASIVGSISGDGTTGCTNMAG
jgi:type IV secretion system protein VirB2